LKVLILALSVVLWACLADARALPVPPIPPKLGPTQDAPVPDPNVQIPHLDPTVPAVSLDMTIHRRGTPDPSLGYAPGTRYRADDDRRLLVVPGVQFRVPFP